MTGARGSRRRAGSHVRRGSDRAARPGGFHLLGEGFGYIRRNGALHRLADGDNPGVLRGSLFPFVP